MRNALRDLAGLRVQVLRNGHIDVHERIEAIEMNEALAAGARHRRIDLGDDPARDAQDRRCEVDGYPKANEAAGIRRGNLKQRYVDRQPSARQKFWHLLQRDGHVVELAALRQSAHFTADEKRPMPIASTGRALRLRQRRCRDKANELKVRRLGNHRLQLCEQGPRGGTSSTYVDATTRRDARQSSLR